MRVSVERLLQGVGHTLLEQVLPHVAGSVARGQLYAAIEVLRNLERRADWAEGPLATEVASAEAALRSAAAELRAARHEPLARRIEASVTGWPGSPIGERARAARTTVGALFAWLDEAPPGAAEAARPALATHLAAQAVRDVSLLALGSLLEEVSRG
jgi:hypothetical protein